MSKESIKQPSILRRWLQIEHERMQTRKALNLLVKQDWSVEFLTSLLVRAANTMKQPLEMTITNKAGVKITVRTSDGMETLYKDDSIFNHLDDELKVKQFVNQMQGKKS